METSIQQVDPWLLTHGLLFIANYSILMPIATFVIYYNRDKFYQLHCVLGIIITILLVAGWASLAGATADKTNGRVYGPMGTSSVAKSHSATGIVARFVAVVVCIIGVVLGVLRMPKHVRTFVRLCHGIGGISISLFGPAVVWNGFVRLQPFIPPISFFDTTPVFWYSTVIALLAYILCRFIVSYIRRKSPKVEREIEISTDIENSVPILTIADTIELIRTDTQGFYLFMGDQLIRLPRSKSDFDHPGGLDPLKPFEGKDISNVFSGIEGFNDSGRQRFHQHSIEACRIIHSFRKGRVTGPLSNIPTDTSTVVGGTRFSMDESCAGGIPMFSIDEEGKSVGTLVSAIKINESDEFPVIRFTFEISDFVMVSSVGAGSKIRLSLSNPTVERTYTVVNCDQEKKRIDLVIKIYSSGEMTSRLALLTENDQVSLSGYSCPPFPRYLEDPTMKSLLLIAAGTGIVPIMYYMERSETETTVLWSLRNREDVFFIDELDNLLSLKPNIRLIVFFTGNGNDSDQMGFSDKVEIRTGRIQVPVTPDCGGAVMSGPRDFVECMHKNLTEVSRIRPEMILSLD